MCICMCVYAQLFVTNFTYMCKKKKLYKYFFTLFTCIIFCCPYFVCSVAAGAHNLSVWSSGNLGLLVPITWRWSICLWFMFCLLVIVRGFLLQILLTFQCIYIYIFIPGSGAETLDRDCLSFSCVLYCHCGLLSSVLLPGYIFQKKKK